MLKSIYHISDVLFFPSIDSALSGSRRVINHNLLLSLQQGGVTLTNHRYLHTKHSITVSSDKQEYLAKPLWSPFPTSTVSTPLHLACILPPPPFFFFVSAFSVLPSPPFWLPSNTCYTPLTLLSPQPTLLSSYLKVSLQYLPTSSYPPLLTSHHPSLSWYFLLFALFSPVFPHYHTLSLQPL